MQASLDLDDDEGHRARGGLTPAQHARWLCETLIRNEEASGDPELIKVAAFRRRCIGWPPRDNNPQPKTDT